MKNVKNMNYFSTFFPLAICISILISCGGAGSMQNAVSVPAAAVSGGETLPKAESRDGLTGKMIVGYQGWFGCPGDFEGNVKWIHWFDETAEPNNFTVDAIPMLNQLAAADLCNTGLVRIDGSPLLLFSSQNKNVVDTHFRWMKEHHIDGVAAQRFVSELSQPSMRNRSDNVLTNIRRAAEANGRTFYLSYDITGADPVTVIEDIRNDWRHLVEDLKITESSNYLVDNGKPVLQLWGFGFADRPVASVDDLASLISDLKNGKAGLFPVTLVGGVPTHWRTLSGDSQTAPAWAQLYRSFDIISPWSVGRYYDSASIADHIQRNVVPDMQETQSAKIRYMPVIFPGFSRYNLMTKRGDVEQALFNQIPRNCGNFMWQQISRLLEANASMLYGAMFDEVDEATALFKLETNREKLPSSPRMLALDQDGCPLPDDWYLSILDQGSAFLKSRQKPPAELASVLTR
jgi:hypothetical protein